MIITPWAIYLNRLSIASQGRVTLPFAFADLVRVCYDYDAHYITEIFLAPLDDGEVDADQDSLRLTAQHLCDQLINGHIATFARPIHGGEVIPVPAGHWEIDDPLPRVATGAFNLEHWADQSAPLTHRLFLDSAAFDRWLAVQEPYGPLTDSQIDEILDPRLRASRNAARDLVRSHVEEHSMPAEPRNTQESSGIGPEMLTIADVCKLTTLSKSTIYQLVKDEKFPLHFKLGANSRWWKSEVLAWITERARNGRN